MSYTFFRLPLRPEVRRWYGSAWRAYRLALIECAQRRCIFCRQEFPAHQLTGAHLSHDPRNLRDTAVACFRCHSRHDAPQRYAMTRRTRAARYGQAWLLPEIEWAPYPAWLIPPAVIEQATQGTFFAPPPVN